MRGLSLSQPWASLIAIGAKSWETRSWSTKYRGWVAIHASQRYPRECQRLCGGDPFAKHLRNGYGLPTGVILAMARIVAVQTTDEWREHYNSDRDHDEWRFGDYRPHRFAWKLEDVRALPKPIPCKGALGLFRLPDPISEELIDFIETGDQRG
ncbi:MAG TPA: ASCH domain-containing protein [Dehalococcoidia bacterium]|jgi:hypothetical protein|nr:ASCH domain-containing protein [Dehalococcoidia bacterium]